MMSAIFGAAILVSQVVVGLHDHHREKSERCDDCGVEVSELSSDMVQLQTAPKWKTRERAAHALRRINWRCHPEVVEVLAFSLLNDPHDEVREEAAQSLAKMAPCVPVAHEALSRAAALDRDRSTRHSARKALKALRHKCDAPCRVCGTVVTSPLPLPGKPVEEPILAPVEGVPSVEPLPEQEPLLEQSAVRPRVVPSRPSRVSVDAVSVPLQAPTTSAPTASRPVRPLSGP